MTKCGLAKLPNFTLVRGVGSYHDNTACVMSAAVACARLKRGEPLGTSTDYMSCCCPLVRGILITLNDSVLWKDNQHRTETLMPFVPRLADTVGNWALMMQRSYMAADWLVRTAMPRALDHIPDAACADAAQRLRAFPELADTESVGTALIEIGKWKSQVASPTLVTFFRTSFTHETMQVLNDLYAQRAISSTTVGWAITGLAHMNYGYEHKDGLLTLCLELVDKLIKVTEEQTSAVVS